MPIKKVKIESTMRNGFMVECKAGKHQIIIDQPLTAGGSDAGPTPLEYLFISLAGCFCAVGRIIAIQRRIDLKSMSIKVEGELDPNGLFGKKTDNRTGFSEIIVTAEIDADLSMKEKENFLAEIENRCPVSDNICKQTTVHSQLIK